MLVETLLFDLIVLNQRAKAWREIALMYLQLRRQPLLVLAAFHARGSPRSSQFPLLLILLPVPSILLQDYRGLLALEFSVLHLLRLINET